MSNRISAKLPEISESQWSIKYFGNWLTVGNWFWCFHGFAGLASANGGKFDQFLSKNGSHIYSVGSMIAVLDSLD